jgi:hypothetical protein
LGWQEFNRWKNQIPRETARNTGSFHYGMRSKQHGGLCMRRPVDYEPRQTLAGSELRRAMTLLMLLLLVGMLMYRSRDPRMWAMFGDADEAELQAEQLVKEQKQAERTIAKPAKPAANRAEAAVGAGSLALADSPTPPVPATEPTAADLVPPPEYDEPAPDAPTTDGDATSPGRQIESEATGRTSPTSGASAVEVDADLDQAPLNPNAIERIELPPLDEDEEEREALKEELSVVSDNQPIAKEDMAAYYRLFRWMQNQSYKQLAAKAIKDPRFGEIFTRPEKFRGKLVELDLRYRRVLLYDDLEKDNPADLEKIWEIVGYNDSSGHNFYMCITDEVPPKMPVGPKATGEGRFVGFFLKLMKYEDGQGKMRAVPVFIGKFRWEPSIPQGPDPEQQIREWTWVMLAGAAFGVMMVLRWVYRRLSPGKPTPVRPNLGVELARRRQARQNDLDDLEEGPDLETWLENPQLGRKAINPVPIDDYDEDSDVFSDEDDAEDDTPRRPDVM